MKILYKIKGDDKIYLFQGSLKRWEEKAKHLDLVEGWFDENRSMASAEYRRKVQRNMNHLRTAQLENLKGVNHD